MIAYALGEDGYSLQKFYNDGDPDNNDDPYGDINNLATGSSTKVWNKATQSWAAYTSSTSSNVTLDKGDVIMVQTTSSGTWYSTGIVDNSANPYQYTLNYQSGLSGYNLVMIPFSKSSLTTVAGLYVDIFGSSAPTDYKRTLSWYSASGEGYYTYEDGPIPAPSSWNSAIKPGTPIMIHVKSTDDSMTWPQ